PVLDLAAVAQLLDVAGAGAIAQHRGTDGLLDDEVEGRLGLVADPAALGRALALVLAHHATSQSASLVLPLIRCSSLSAPITILPPACMSWKVAVVIRSFLYRLRR